jgi:hypothetical protein
MTLREFDACVRGYIRANGGKEEASAQDYDEYFVALAEAERLGLV